MPQSQTKIPSWVGQEKVKLDDEFRKKLKEENKLPYYTFPVGLTKVSIDINTPPRTSENGKKVLRGLVKKEDFDIPLSDVLFRKVINLLEKGITEFDIIRTGQGKNDTRYDIVTNNADSQEAK